MNKAAALKKLEQMEFYAKAIIEISKDLKNDLDIEDKPQISAYRKKKMEREAEMKIRLEKSRRRRFGK
ncbi:MAG TPA: hypothetical protein VK489_05800 [Ferruginibacter sp.]|nr:hypothetical protein [Ferruginibacter sp.]